VILDNTNKINDKDGISFTSYKPLIWVPPAIKEWPHTCTSVWTWLFRYDRKVSRLHQYGKLTLIRLTACHAKANIVSKNVWLKIGRLMTH